MINTCIICHFEVDKCLCGHQLSMKRLENENKILKDALDNSHRVYEKLLKDYMELKKEIKCKH